MKKLLTLSLIVFSFYLASAQKVDSKVARQAAENFWNKSFSTSGNVTLSYFLSKQSDTTLFVYNIGNDGFVIVSGDYSVVPVLAWSDEGSFKSSYLAPATVEWLQSYSNQIHSCRSSITERAKDKGWGELLSDYTPELSKKSTKTVSPLISTKWDQGKYYNYKCPVYSTGPDGHCVTGCVATAMAQIMKYYNYPDQGVGSHWYSHPHFGNIGADFSATTYDWTTMGAYGNLTNEDAIGTLIFHCGVSVDMDYSPTESGAMSENAVTAFKNYFHYRNTVKMEQKHYYSDFDWIAILKDNLDQNHPIM
ncbi:MAG: C10 family peptidase, partial [Bacteroidota bacterium]